MDGLKKAEPSKLNRHHGHQKIQAQTNRAPRETRDKVNDPKTKTAVDIPKVTKDLMRAH
jgi:hypothetical protein